MKNSPVSILACGCLVLGAFLAGMFVGRNITGDVIQTSLRVSTSSVSTSATQPSATFTNERININTADLATLMRLPGIGEKLAQRIIDYRNTHGSFKDSTELKKVYGINEKLFDAIKYLITTGG